MNKLADFYQGKRVLITGNTGFKGSWLTRILLKMGATVIGYSLQPPTEPNLYTLADLSSFPLLKQEYGDVQDYHLMYETFKKYRPEIVIHLAAQPIVRESYRNPQVTYVTNVMGTVNVCECVRLSNEWKNDGGFREGDYAGVRSFVNVTTDKVYQNNEWEYGYREDDPLGGFDPYSSSKACSEIVTAGYRHSFFAEKKVAVSTARAGNVIGGGDFSSDRIIPDCVRAITDARAVRADKGQIRLRNPKSVRPYQHVLEPLFAYLMIAMKQYEDPSLSGSYNIGPDDSDCKTTEELTDQFCTQWNKEIGSSLPKLCWMSTAEDGAPHEANLLKLDCSRIKSKLGWKPRWHMEEGISQIIRWTKVWLDGGDVGSEMDREIEMFSSLV